MVNRRKFIQTGVVAASVLSVNASFCTTENKSANEIVNLGIIGTGDRGSGLANLMQDMPEFRIVAGCDVIPQRLDAFKALADKNAELYKDYRFLLDNPDIDAVLIATPFSMHHHMAVDALDAGKHVYCEKTMVKGIDKVKDLVKKVKDQNNIFQVGHQYHHSRLYKKVVQIIKSGYIGEVSAFQCQWNRNGDWRRPVSDPDLERIINWRMYKEFSGGLVAELCSHQIDFVNWVLDAHPQEVIGMGGIDYWKDGRETYDNVHLTYLYPNGVKAKFTCLTTNGYGDYQIKVMGKKGTIILDYDKAWIYSEEVKEKGSGIVDGVSGATLNAWEKGEGAPIKAEHKNPSIFALQDFQENIRYSKTPISDVRSGASAAIAVQMGLDAMEKKQAETWKDEYNV